MIPSKNLRPIMNHLVIENTKTQPLSYYHVKDEILNRISETANVAQFVSFDPSLCQRYSRVKGYEPNYRFRSFEEAVEILLRTSNSGSVNIRSYIPSFPKSKDFIYELRTVDEVVSNVKKLINIDNDLCIIVNETVDINDGGVSGVAVGDVMEFAPKSTPRCVEKPGTAALPRKIGLELLKTIYHFYPALDYPKSTRVEFSIHPLKVGFRHDHTIIWELEDVGDAHIQVDIKWSNLFSKFIGDKAYGLLIANLIGLDVPHTTVFPRNVAPFQYGSTTNTSEYWIRTCPVEQIPGKFTTLRGWTDPFKLMCDEDPDGNMLSSIISQESVAAKYSGALVTSYNGHVTIEGVEGYGDDFMVGIAEKKDLPDHVKTKVLETYNYAFEKLGPVRMEWVYDGTTIWVVQLHKGATSSEGTTIYPGNPRFYNKFSVSDGIEKLRSLINEVQDSDEGIELIGNVGITSHFGDVLRKAEIPSKISNI